MRANVLDWLSHPVGTAGPGATVRHYSVGLVPSPAMRYREPALGASWVDDGAASSSNDVVGGSVIGVHQVAVAIPEGTTSDAVVWVRSDVPELFAFTELYVQDSSSSDSGRSRAAVWAACLLVLAAPAK